MQPLTHPQNTRRSVSRNWGQSNTRVPSWWQPKAKCFYFLNRFLYRFLFHHLLLKNCKLSCTVPLQKKKNRSCWLIVYSDLNTVLLRSDAKFRALTLCPHDYGPNRSAGAVVTSVLTSCVFWSKCCAVMKWCQVSCSDSMSTRLDPNVPLELLWPKVSDPLSGNVVQRKGFDVTIGECAVSDRNLAHIFLSRQTKSLMSPSDRVLCLIRILNTLFPADTNKVFDVTIGQSIVSRKNLEYAVPSRHKQSLWCHHRTEYCVC